MGDDVSSMELGEHVVNAQLLDLDSAIDASQHGSPGLPPEMVSK
ncbi:hypothetical protein [Pseudonocardia charpentierae]|uniref:Uncharacterized protein n=1 Tax=Pseudonocardia charpentierae TaxID=3075545 RepID=A0ABU2NEH7_9PSEU|nr:hypothetical protein [Pseudonocardia sp. DSM 45834]MDT0351659.1 hypothetical protein [Pseudonocardia sp. DSM 45834]